MIRILQINIRGLLLPSKAKALNYLLILHNIHIVLLQEWSAIYRSFLHQKNSIQFPHHYFPNYQFKGISTDVGFLIHKKIQQYDINYHLKQNTKYDFKKQPHFISCYWRPYKLCITNFYRNPKSKHPEIFTNIIKSNQQYYYYLIGGDINHSHIKWGGIKQNPDKLTQPFDQFNLQNLNNHHKITNHIHKSIIDLSMISPTLHNYTHWNTKPNWINQNSQILSDHYPIFININFDSNQDITYVRTVWNLRSKRWKDFKNKLEKGIPHLQKTVDLNQRHSILVNFINQTAHKTIGTKIIDQTKHSNITKKTLQFCKYIHKLRKRYARSLHKNNAFKQYIKKLQKIKKKKINKDKKRYKQKLNKILEKGNLSEKQFWNALSKYHIKIPFKLPNFILPNNTTITQIHQKLNILAKHFQTPFKHSFVKYQKYHQTIHTYIKNFNPFYLPPLPLNDPLNHPITINELKLVIAELPNEKNTWSRTNSF